MMHLKINDLNNPYFANGLSRLMGHPFPLKIGYRLGRLEAKLQSQFRQARTDWGIQMQKVEWVEEEGKPRVPKDLAAYEKLEKEFLDIDVELEAMPIHVDEIKEAKLTPPEWVALAPLLVGLETLEESHGEKSKVQ